MTGFPSPALFRRRVPGSAVVLALLVTATRWPQRLHHCHARTLGPTAATAASRIGYAEVDGARIHYQVYGDLDLGPHAVACAAWRFHVGRCDVAADRPAGSDAAGDRVRRARPWPDRRCAGGWAMTRWRMTRPASSPRSRSKRPMSCGLFDGRRDRAARRDAPPRTGRQTGDHFGCLPARRHAARTVKSIASLTPEIFAGSPIESGYRKTVADPRRVSDAGQRDQGARRRRFCVAGGSNSRDQGQDDGHLRRQ